MILKYKESMSFNRKILAKKMPESLQYNCASLPFAAGFKAAGLKIRENKAGALGIS